MRCESPMRGVTLTTQPLGRAHRAGAACFVLSLLLASCDVASMALIQDKRVEILEPKDRSTVSLPFTIKWNVFDFTITGADGKSRQAAGYFAVFIDRQPIPPRKTLKWFVQQDESCYGEACGSLGNLEDVYTTDDQSLEIEQLPAISEGPSTELHEATIILLDGTGARIGESAFHVRFKFDRGDGL